MHTRRPSNPLGDTRQTAFVPIRARAKVPSIYINRPKALLCTASHMQMPRINNPTSSYNLDAVIKRNVETTVESYKVIRIYMCYTSGIGNRLNCLQSRRCFSRRHRSGFSCCSGSRGNWHAGAYTARLFSRFPLERESCVSVSMREYR